MTTSSLDPSLSAEFLKFLYGDQQGWACLAVKGKVDHWRQEFYHWPDQQASLLDAAMRRAPTADVYVGMLLCTERKRGKTTALPGCVLWCDVDHWLTVDQEMFLQSHDSWIIESGTPGHAHVYLRCRELLEPTELEDLNRGLAQLLDGDAKWSSDTVLRLAGVNGQFLVPAGGHEKSPPLRRDSLLF
ncbi:MAG: hypothetical protein JWM55_2118, partial [Acidimicrobiaceae bacterium]|nr:hypothetical protein [Acidimicrobiaceae bacterium]